MRQNIPDGWKENTASNGHVLLFKLYETGSIAKSITTLDKIKEIIIANENAQYVYFTLSNDYITITLNDLGNDELIGGFIMLAEEIDKKLS